jgi:hypothetical protein
VNARNLVLSGFIVATIILASLVATESVDIDSLKSQIGALTPVTVSDSTTTTCTNTGRLGCPILMNQTFTISVAYSGPWGVSYQGYLGSQQSGTLVDSGSFYGYAPGNNVSVTVGGITSSQRLTLCVEAQKLDASNNSTLMLDILPPRVANQTSLAYGKTGACVVDAIA